jgi:hypothetical protein
MIRFLIVFACFLALATALDMALFHAHGKPVNQYQAKKIEAKKVQASHR